MNTYKRLAKVATEFNIGVFTVIEFLEKHGYKCDPDPNFKINEDQYQLIKTEFKEEKK